MESWILVWKGSDYQKSAQKISKRFFDFLFSLVIVFLSIPIFLVVFVVVRLFNSGPIFYVQPRIGQHGKVFNCIKFRTMYMNADERLQEILQNNPELQKEWEKNQKLKNDPRVFPFGKWLRKTSLDELPQFLNVLKGDLSVVGPRPYMLSQQDSLGNKAGAILSVRPGITGLWQTSGRSGTSFKNRLYLDVEYINKKSFFFDLYLIIKTIPIVLCTKNAY